MTSLQTTQQNGARVEQAAAAAESLRQQAQQLVQAVAVFKLSGMEVASHAAPAVVHRSPPKKAMAGLKHPAPRAAKSPAVTKPQAEMSASAPAARGAAGGDDDWTSF